MAKMDVWPAIHTERRALASQLDGVSEDQWATRSLCSDWTVRDVLAHMTATAQLSGASFFPKLIGSGFSLTKLQAKDIARERGSSGEDALNRFKTQIDSTGRPPGPPETMLGEVMIHSEDIRRPLALTHTYDPVALTQAADFLTGSNLIIGTKRRIADVSLKATDVDWSHGHGPTVEGPMLSLLMAMTGRKAVLGDLAGDGVAVIRDRP